MEKKLTKQIYNEREPLITFALFAYNQEEYIMKAVKGAFSQTYSRNFGKVSNDFPLH